MFKFLMKKLGHEDSEDVEKWYNDPEWLRSMNDEELDVEYRSMSAAVSRMADAIENVKAEYEARGLDLPSGLAIDGLVGKNIAEIAKPEVISKQDAMIGRGPISAKIAFVGASPTKLDIARNKPFSGKVGKIMRDLYLKAADIAEENAYFTNICPDFLSDEAGNPREPTPEEVEKHISRLVQELNYVNPDYIVALGKTVADSLGNADEWLPHPIAVLIHGNSGEVARKMSRISKKIEKRQGIKYSLVKSANIFKAEEELQVVYGVVIEPEVEDTDGNWTTEAEITKAAHEYLVDFRVVGEEHVFHMSDAQVVESYIAPADFTIGGEEVRKGSWIMGVKINSPDNWDRIKKGEFTGFSFGGTAKINPESRL